VEHPADSVDDQFPLRFSEFLYGIVCLGLSIASALHNNVWMGGLAAAIFVLQVILFQFAISKIENFGKVYVRQ
jgi:hypothetical protein